MTKERWRGEKNLPRVYPEANSGSDLVSNHDGQPFAPIAADVLSCARPSWWMFGISPVAEDVLSCGRFEI